MTQNTESSTPKLKKTKESSTSATTSSSEELTFKMYVNLAIGSPSISLYDQNDKIASLNYEAETFVGLTNDQNTFRLALEGIFPYVKKYEFGTF